MSAIESLFASDTLNIGPISFHRSVPIFGESDSGTSGFCTGKTSNTLALTLNARQFGIPIDLHLPFTGTANSSGEVTWTIDQAADVGLFGVHVNRVHGQIVATVVGTATSRGTTCDGRQMRAFKTSFTSIP